MADEGIAEDNLRQLLLDMLSSMRAPSAQDLDALGDAEWATIADMASQHRMVPLLHYRRTAATEPWPVPEHLAANWARTYRQSALRALNYQRALRRIAVVFDGVGIRYAALKGAYLAHYAWPHAALRPMRDLDILVAPERAREAYMLLTDIDFYQPQQTKASVDLGLETNKHLPMLWSDETGVSVEIHTRLLAKELRDKSNGADWFATAAFARAKSTNASDPICYLDATDTLLHVILHAVVDHQFNNGPIVIGDVAHLVRTQPIDWERFGKMVAKLDCARGCQLAFALTEHYEGILPIGWGDHKNGLLPAPVVAAAGHLTLIDVAHRDAMELRLRLQKRRGGVDKVRMLRDRAIPTGDTLAGIAGFRRVTGWAWLAYPIWLVARLYRYRPVFDARDPIASAARHGTKVNIWLAS